jgi:5-methylcytosine-specific restriction endonuclease McrA
MQPNFKRKREKLFPEEYERRKQEVLEGDNYCCRICFSKKNLDVDHIKKRSQGGGDEISNLRTLCRKCHNQEDNTVNSSKLKNK